MCAPPPNECIPRGLEGYMVHARYAQALIPQALVCRRTLADLVPFSGSCAYLTILPAQQQERGRIGRDWREVGSGLPCEGWNFALALGFFLILSLNLYSEHDAAS